MKVEIVVNEPVKKSIDVDFPLYLRKVTQSYSEVKKINQDGKGVTISRYFKCDSVDISIDTLDINKDLSFYLFEDNYLKVSKELYEEEVENAIKRLKE